MQRVRHWWRFYAAALAGVRRSGGSRGYGPSKLTPRRQRGFGDAYRGSERLVRPCRAVGDNVERRVAVALADVGDAELLRASVLYRKMRYRAVKVVQRSGGSGDKRR